MKSLQIMIEELENGQRYVKLSFPSFEMREFSLIFLKKKRGFCPQCCGRVEIPTQVGRRIIPLGWHPNEEGSFGNPKELEKLVFGILEKNPGIKESWGDICGLGESYGPKWGNQQEED